ncbi:hypothetical protein K8I61_02520 [bacterium]|nr:hypothetical protein [bacterium]
MVTDIDPADDPERDDDAAEPGAATTAADRWSYFGAAERPYFQAFRRFRYGLFNPILGHLAARGIGPDHVTGASFFVLLVGFPLCYGARAYGAAFIVLAIHLVLDGIDGPLAQYLGRKGAAHGALMDMTNDVTGMVIVIVTATYFGPIPWPVGATYVITYLYVTIFAVGQNLLSIPYAYVVKTKYPVYILLFAWWMGGLPPNVVTLFMAVATVYMGVSAFYGFLRVARKLR